MKSNHLIRRDTRLELLQATSAARSDCTALTPKMKAVVEKRGVTSEKAIKILHENGIEVSQKEAEIILYFLYFLAKLTVNQYVNNESKSINQ